MGLGVFVGLCSFGCNFGFCLMYVCICKEIGVLIDVLLWIGKSGYYVDGIEDYGLCNFVVSYGYIFDVCGFKDDSGDGIFGCDVLIVMLDFVVWMEFIVVC